MNTKLHCVSASICFTIGLLAVQPAVAQTSDDPVLDAKIDVAVLSADYTDAYPKVVAAKDHLAFLLSSTPLESSSLYHAHVQERIEQVQREDTALSRTYKEQHPKRKVLAGELVFLQKELHQSESH
jgi:septal ring factor EnvC (AmiA/AmiB activator)